MIEEVTEPSEWTSPKLSVRITCNFYQLNKFIQRETFKLPGVDYTLAQLGSSKFFSRLAFNSGIH